MKENKYKELSIREFTRAAAKYETEKAGIYDLCKKDYPDILRATPHNTAAASIGVFELRYSHFPLQYTKYCCKKLPSSELKYTRYLLLPHYAVLP